MKNVSLKKLTAALALSAAILTVDIMPSMAQNTSTQGKSSTSNSHSQHSNHSGNNQGSGQKMQGNSRSSAYMDATFIKKASEGNLAEVELGTMALQKASSQEVKDFAQQMIDHHTQANEQLISIVSGSASMNSGSQNVSATGDNSGNADMSTSKKSGNMSSGNTSSNRGSMSGSTTQSGNTSDDANTGDSPVDPQKSAALGGSSGTNGNTAQSVDDNPDPNTNTRTTDPNRNVSDGTGGGGAGANSGGTTSSTSTNDVGRSTMDDSNAGNTSDQTGLTNDSGNLRKGTGGSSSIYGTSDAGNGGFDNPIASTLSPEHVAIKNKLTNLSGAEFDKAYMQAMVKDHAKTVELFESQINKGQNTELVNFAKMGLPMIKEHYQKAQALNGSKGSMNKGSSTNKSSSSKQ